MSLRIAKHPYYIIRPYIVALSYRFYSTGPLNGDSSMMLKKRGATLYQILMPSLIFYQNSRLYLTQGY